MPCLLFVVDFPLSLLTICSNDKKLSSEKKIFFRVVFHLWGENGTEQKTIDNRLQKWNTRIFFPFAFYGFHNCSFIHSQQRNSCKAQHNIKFQEERKIMTETNTELHSLLFNCKKYVAFIRLSPCSRMQTSPEQTACLLSCFYCT